jgi:hypothetical protein
LRCGLRALRLCGLGGLQRRTVEVEATHGGACRELFWRCKEAHEQRGLDKALVHCLGHSVHLEHVEGAHVIIACVRLRG